MQFKGVNQKKGRL